VLSDSITAARTHGWTIEEILAKPKLSLIAFRRSAQPSLPGPPGRKKVPQVYVSTGIHGDEPAGPLAMRQLLQENRWPQDVDYWLVPCLNPSGCRLNRRENAEGIDLNREYLNPKAEETLAHIAWLERQPAFDLCLCLHEDWESNGFYVYELNPDNRPSLAPAIVNGAAQACPIDLSELIEGRPAQGGIIRPNFDPRERPQWPEAFFLLTHKTRLSYTLEAPSDFPLGIRVAALAVGVQQALEEENARTME
jgi:protein MpaA